MLKTVEGGGEERDKEWRKGVVVVKCGRKPRLQEDESIAPLMGPRGVGKRSVSL